MSGRCEMTVSLCIIAYNEEKALPSLLRDVLSQTYPKRKTEIVLVNSGSSDGTGKMMTDFCQQNEADYQKITLLDNPERIQAAGWNTAIKKAAGEIIIRVDAHASIPPEFIEKNVLTIQSGEYVCGGARPSNILDSTPFREMLLLAESSMFGSSIAGYRRKSEGKRYVSSLFHGAYRREVFAKVGGFNKDLGRTEDNELHWRIRQNGYRICQSDEIISYQNIRPSLSGMLRQKYGNGKWIGLTTGVCPKCLSIFHFVPFCFVMALILSAVLCVIGVSIGSSLLILPLLIIAAAYLGADFLMSVTAFLSAKKKHPCMLLLFLIFPVLHIVYGVGTLVGLISLPHWKSRLDDSAQREIEEVKKCVAANTILEENI